jgi:KaiC/GvpD/RAD55 family RecA-like ATPase
LAGSLGDAAEESAQSITFVTDDLEEIYAKTVKQQGLRWRLTTLNRALGSLRKGDFGFVFARPETGKTTFLASECTYMAHQASGPVLWFNNEEQGEKVMLRCYQAALGATLEQLFTSIGKAREQFKEYTGGRLKLVDQAVLNRREVESICQSIQPSLIVFDQIDKISGFAADRDDLVLGAIYQWARELAKTYCPVIGVCQADGTAEGVKFLTMSHVSNAKTSKQAEADWILGIGRSNDAGFEDVRHFNVSKNKLVGDSDSVPSERHHKWDTLIEPTVARYRDILV